MSGINADPWKAFHIKVETFSNLYAIQIGLGGSYGHWFKNMVLDELVWFDGVVIHDGVRGGSNGAVHRQWMDCADSDMLVQKSMMHTWWLQIKERVMKLNNNQASPKRGEEGCNLAFKFDMLYEVLIMRSWSATSMPLLSMPKKINVETRWHMGTPAMEKLALVVVWWVG
jgi:hypothetical protein